MAYVSVAVIAAVSVLAMWLARRLAHAPGARPGDELGPEAAWARARALRRAIRRKIEGRASQLVGELHLRAEEHTAWIEASGQSEAETVSRLVGEVAQQKIAETGFFGRVGFDAKKLVEGELLPVLIEHYDAFRKTAADRLRERFEGALGMKLETALEVTSTATGATPEARRIEQVLAGAAAIGVAGAPAAAGVFGLLAPMVAFPIAGALTALLGGGYLLWKYESKQDLLAAVLGRVQSLTRKVFHGDGYRNADGSLIPSATSWAKQTTVELEQRLVQQLEHRAEAMLLSLDDRYQALERRWNEGELPVARLLDDAHLVAELYPAAEASHAG